MVCSSHGYTVSVTAVSKSTRSILNLRAWATRRRAHCVGAKPGAIDDALVTALIAHFQPRFERESAFGVGVELGGLKACHDARLAEALQGWIEIDRWVSRATRLARYTVP